MNFSSTIVVLLIAVSRVLALPQSITGLSRVRSVIAPLPPPPDLADYSIRPYPPLEPGVLGNVSLQNLLGTRLYGWLIQIVFENINEVYSVIPFPFSHWIKVRCSSKVDSEGDPKNICGDREDPPQCLPDGPSRPDPEMERIEAFSDNNMPGEYDETTFCSRFFEHQSLTDAVNLGISKRSKDMWDYDNRARVFLHEVTHLDFFVNAPAQTPFIDDLTISLKKNKLSDFDSVYGPFRAKVLANYRTNRGGFYTQRNADNYAWYALTKYVWGKLGGKIDDYPSDPQTLGVKPVKAPTNRDGQRITELENEETTDPAFVGVTNITFPFNGMTEEEFDTEVRWYNRQGCLLEEKVECCLSM
ncbi:uncharacterized protein A1O9_05223 [Exophiala aquamarina CBS 119918]|uniref:Lysine-specific metallo-endopeptidase domain-containing protein n=1 Tax=Exophiala aquamarina CBS 119918 TaxID=1182545 RepID=A0A072PBV7_9EURO|nr:uncharacterized protein A1O9_05223 [Exophiala aquamarina CBS 119918]KEF57306.1 hypothetical protein A1O9_05223 [Exophiala aquamarina CBS 119918]